MARCYAKNEFHFSNVYRSVNYIGVVSKTYMDSLVFLMFMECKLHWVVCKVSEYLRECKLHWVVCKVSESLRGSWVHVNFASDPTVVINTLTKKN